MDFTPGGFLNRAPKDFKTTAPAEVMGTRARQLAMTVLYPSPLLVMCDSPQNYRGQPGIEFLKAIPTVWDETVVISGEIGKSIVMARRSGNTWYLVALNGDDATQVKTPLSFLGKGKWELQNFADKADGSDYQAVVESKENVTAKSLISLSLAPAGGYAGIIRKN
jgi:alpha-glucosidase